MPQPLPLPENYNPQTHLLAKVTENGLFHETRAGAAFAHRLVANGAPEDLALAENVLDVVLGCQERRAGDPHHGNFTWMLEDDHVEDLNAVEFNLEHLIPMMLPARRPASRRRCRRGVLDAIRLGLDEIRRLDVSVAYTNICLLDILNTSLGGELLGDRAIAERGYRKLAAWMAFTDSQGIAFEWNSPTYGAVDIRALKLLADLTRDEETRIRARTCRGAHGAEHGAAHPCGNRSLGRAARPRLSSVGRLRDAAGDRSGARLDRRWRAAGLDRRRARCQRPPRSRSARPRTQAGRWGSPPTTARRSSWGRRRRNTPASRMC